MAWPLADNIFCGFPYYIYLSLFPLYCLYHTSTLPKCLGLINIKLIITSFLISSTCNNIHDYIASLYNSKVFSSKNVIMFFTLLLKPAFCQ